MRRNADLSRKEGGEMVTDKELESAKESIDKAREATARLEALLKPAQEDKTVEALKDLFGMMRGKG